MFAVAVAEAPPPNNVLGLKVSRALSFDVTDLWSLGFRTQDGDRVGKFAELTPRPLQKSIDSFRQGKYLSILGVVHGQIHRGASGHPQRYCTAVHCCNHSY